MKSIVEYFITFSCLFCALSAQANPVDLNHQPMDLSIHWDTYQLADAGDMEAMNKGSVDSSVALSFPKDINRSPYRITLFSPEEGEDGERLFEQTMLIFALAPTLAYSMTFLPEDITGWDGEDKGNLGDKWKDNVTGGAVWDDDDWYINYIGHPYFGGVYYQVARKSGYNQWNSFTYSALMSTFYWEYGVEAVMERPAIQDIVVTPVLGWVYGEWAHQKEKEIRADGGRALGSTFWGSTALFFLDPVDNIAIGLNKVFGKSFIKTGSMTVTQSPMNREVIAQNDLKDYWGIQIQLLTH
jgi:hypothetical protein